MNSIPPVALVFSPDQKDAVCTIEDIDLPEGERRHSSCAYLLGPYEIIYKDRSYNAYKMSFLYPTNPGFRVLSMTLGYHQYDTEYLIFLVNKYNQRLEWVFFSAHSTAEGNWRAIEDCRFDATGRLLAYVSPTSHAMYPDPGRHFRLYGIANDVTVENGVVWYVPRVVEVQAGQDSRSNYNRTIIPPEHTMSRMDRLFGYTLARKKLGHPV